LAVRLGIQAARALGAAHRAGIVHRDVKPANLFVVSRDDGATVKVLDFGVARVDGDGGLTKTGALVGTPTFMPPEALAGRPADARGDVWGLAATLRFALTGKQPREVLAGCDPQIPAELAPILDAALAADPAARPADGAALAAALAALPLAAAALADGAAVQLPTSADAGAPGADPHAPTARLR
jgi:serine/threonine-protein kinase